MAKFNKTLTAALAAIVASGRVSEEVGKPLIAQGLITVDVNDVIAGDPANGGDLAKATLTQKAIDGMPKQAPAGSVASAPSNFGIITNAIPPESKRGAGRVAGPSKYPFDSLTTGQSFFVSANAETPDPIKSMNSAVSNANNKYRVDTGRTEQVERTKRDGKKAALDAAGNKIKETATVAVYEYPRKFIVRGVKNGQKCGEWVAPADGVLITREK